MGSGFLKRKKEAKALQEQLAGMKAKMETLEIEGSAGNGLVKITLNGEGDMKQIRINPECVDKDDIDGLQDLIKAAYTDAKKKIDDQGMQGMQSMGSLPMIPGFKF